jgi:hypothetical protein
VFQSNQATPGNFSFEIYTMKADGTGMTQLTSNTVFDGFDGWLWGYASASASAQQALAKSHHGAAARAEKIKHLQQRRR